MIVITANERTRQKNKRAARIVTTKYIKYDKQSKRVLCSIAQSAVSLYFILFIFHYSPKRKQKIMSDWWMCAPYTRFHKQHSELFKECMNDEQKLQIAPLAIPIELILKWRLKGTKKKKQQRIMKKKTRCNKEVMYSMLTTIICNCETIDYCNLSWVDLDSNGYEVINSFKNYELNNSIFRSISSIYRFVCFLIFFLHILFVSNSNRCY